jgi:hypothetical protein
MLVLMTATIERDCDDIITVDMMSGSGTSKINPDQYVTSVCGHT